MGARRYQNFMMRGKRYADADVAALDLDVTATTVRKHLRDGTPDLCGAGKSGVDPMPVAVRGKRFKSPQAAADYFEVCIDHVYRRLAEGRPDDIGRPAQRGMYLAHPITLGPVKFRSKSEASRELGLGKDYVQRAFARNSKRMIERVIAAAMTYAAKHPSRDAKGESV